MGKEIGSLEVTVVDAVQLPVVNHIGKQNPFVVLVVGSERRQTKPSKTGHRNPVWGERLIFTLDSGISEIAVDVFHDSKLGRPSFIGTATVPLSQVISSGNCSRRVRLGDSGEIRLQLVFKPAVNQTSGVSSGNTDFLAGQALHNAANSLATALPSKGGLASGPSWQLRHSLQPPVDTGGPNWLLHGAPSAQSSAVPIEDSRLNSGASEGGNQKPESVPSESGRRNSLSSERPSGSPQRHFRTKFGQRLGSLWYGKEAKESSRASTNSLESSIYARPSGGLSDPRLSSNQSDASPEVAAQPAAVAEPSSSAPGMPLSESSEQPKMDISPSEMLPPTQSPLLQSDRLQPEAQQQSWQGFKMEPVEGMHFGQRGSGGGDWLSVWEQQHEGPRRRTADSGMSFPDAQTLAPRRQTDSASMMPAPPPMESGFVQSGEDGNTRFYRTGCQFQEWGESRLPAIPSTFHSTLPGFGSTAVHTPQWDGTAQHERLVSSIEEMRRSVTGTPLPSGPRLPPGDTTEGLSSSRSNFVDTAMRPPSGSVQHSHIWSSASRNIHTAHSTGVLGSRGSQDHPDVPGGKNDALSVETSKRSDSAPAGVSSGITIPQASTSYPQPRYGGADDIANRFGSLKGPGSPALLSSMLPGSTSSFSRLPESTVDSGAAKVSHGGDRRRDVNFDDSSYLRPEEQLGGEAPADPTSFVGMVSPFAEDTSPLKEESLPSEDGETSRHSRTKSSGGRVPIKEVRQEIEAAAEGSIRIAANASSRESENAQASLSALLSDSNNDWLIDEKDLEILVDEHGRPIKLGSGSFGTVYKGIKDQSTDVAIKTLKCETQKDMNLALQEVAILKKQLHPNIVQFLGACIGQGSIQMVTELLAGNLFKALQGGKCTWHKGGRAIAMNTASALIFLHKRKTVHLDVKSANILLTTNKIAKLADLGLSAMMNTNSFVDTIKGLGTLQWTSPEVLLGTHAVTSASDVYSFGVVLWEICTGEVPVRGKLRRITPEEAPSEIADLIWQCLDSEPKKRPTMQEVYNVLRDLGNEPRVSTSIRSSASPSATPRDPSAE